jgi:hypothetical protein
MIKHPKLEKEESVVIETHDGWKFEVFPTETGSLGLTVYEKGKGPDDEDDMNGKVGKVRLTPRWKTSGHRRP